MIVECCEDDEDTERSPPGTSLDNMGGFPTNSMSPEGSTSTASPLHCHGDEVTPVFCHWAKRTPVAMEMDDDRDVTRTLSMTTGLTAKLPKSPHPLGLQKSHKTLPSSSVTTKHTVTPVVNHRPPASRIPVSVIKKVVSMTVEREKVTTPNDHHDNNHKSMLTLTPGSRQPFANLPPIFAPTLVKSKNSSISPPSDQSPSSNDSPPSQPSHHTTVAVDDSTMMGFEDNFVPFNNATMDLSPNTTEWNRTYHVEDNNAVLLCSLNSTYTRALSELEQDQTVSDKMAARKVGQEIWQQVRKEEDPPVRLNNSQPLTSVQCDGGESVRL